MKKKYDSYDDHELIYLINDNNEFANDLMYEKYRPLVMHYAKKYSFSGKNSGLEINDLFQEGMLGFYNAIKNYNQDGDAKFCTFASVCINRAISNAIRNAKAKKQIYLNEALSLDYVYELYEKTLGDMLSDDELNPEKIVISKEDEKNLYNKIIKNLSSFEMEIFELKRLGFEYDEIEMILGVSKKKITNTMQRIRYKVKQLI